MSERDELARTIAENNRLSSDAADFFDAADAILDRGYHRHVKHRHQYTPFGDEFEAYLAGYNSVSDDDDPNADSLYRDYLRWRNEGGAR